MSEIEPKDESVQDVEKGFETKNIAETSLQRNQTEIFPVELEPNHTEITLETIFNQLKLMQQGMQQLKESLEWVKKELAEVKQQQTQTSDLSRIDKKTYSQESQLSSSSRKSLVNNQSRVKKLDFNVVIFLYDNGEEKLQEELKNQSNTELVKIARLEGIKIGKNIKNLERDKIIQEIILSANRRLKQGSVFLKD